MVYRRYILHLNQDKNSIEDLGLGSKYVFYIGSF